MKRVRKPWQVLLWEDHTLRNRKRLGTLLARVDRKQQVKLRSFLHA